MLMSVGNVGRQSGGVPVPGISVLNPTGDYSFLGPSLPGGFTYTRGSTATYFDIAGTLQSAAIDTPRFDYHPVSHAARGLLIEESRTNAIRNNTMVGAVVGTPGTPPTNWIGFSTLNGLVGQVVAFGTVNGISYIDMRLSGTTSGAGTFTNITMETAGQISAANGQAWAESAWLGLVGGSVANVSMTIGAGVYDGAVGYLGELATRATFVPTGTLTRIHFPGTIAIVGAASLNPYLQFTYTGGGGIAIDFTLRIGMPQLEFGSTMTSVIPTSGSAATRQQDSCTRVHGVASYPVSYYVEGMEPVIQAPIAGFLTIDDGGINNRIVFRETAGFNLFNAGLYTGGTLQAANPTIGSSNAGSAWKAAIMFNTSAVRGSMNGGAVIGAAGGTAPAAGLMTTMRIGQGQINGLYANGYVKRVQYWAGGLSDAQLVQAST